MSTRLPEADFAVPIHEPAAWVRIRDAEGNWITVTRPDIRIRLASGEVVLGIMKQAKELIR